MNDTYFASLVSHLEGYIRREIALIADDNIMKRPMAHSMLAQAKRLRGGLLLMALESYGFFWQRGLYPAVALEYVHCYSLIHDDLPCMDDDYLRRGVPTSHVVFGDAMALLTGDSLLTEAFGLLRRGCELGAYTGDVVMSLTQMLVQAAGINGMIAGQATEMTLAARQKTSSMDEMLDLLRDVHRLKTGALLRAPFSFAAAIGHLPAEETKLLEDFGTQFGLVFQIQDDLLDVLGHAETMGKHTGRDARQDKITYPSLLGIEGAKQLLSQETERLYAMLTRLDCEQEKIFNLITELDSRSR